MAVGTRGTAGVIGTPGAEGIVDGVWGKRRSIAAVGVTGRIRIIRVLAQFAAVISLLVIQPRRIGGKRIRRRLIAEGTAIPEGIGGGLRIEGIRTQLAEIFRLDSEWEQQ